MTFAIPQLVPDPGLRERVYETLENLIVTRVLEPGQRLLEVELAERLGVSRNPVREALSMLARDGWVEVRRRAGTYVRVASPKEISDFFDLRASLEAFTGGEAARKAKTDAIRDLWASCDEGDSALAQSDIPAMVAANASFHRLVLEMADNVVLTESIAVMRKRLQWYFGPVAGLRGGRSWGEHRGIVAAIESGDVDAASRLMYEHSRHVEVTYRSGSSV